MISVCDYKGFDYKAEFWDNANRDYENLLEQTLVRELVAKYGVSNGDLIDLGCGFGRLFPAYEAAQGRMILFDYAQNLLDQAKATIQDPRVRFVQGNAYALPFSFPVADTVVSVRTLHHFSDLETLFANVRQAVKPGGVFIFEIPNQRHILNRIKYQLGRLKQDPDAAESLRYSDAYVNHHPQTTYRHLNNAGFEICETINTSFFRSRLLKRLVSPQQLVRWDKWCQKRNIELGPSIYVAAKRLTNQPLS